MTLRSALMFAFASILTALSCGACASARAAEAEASYLGMQLKCVDSADTRAEAEACRRAVRDRWGIAETSTRDAGGDR